MNGRTKRFIEDMIIFIVVLIVVAAIYYVVSNFILNEDEVVSEKKVEVVTKKKDTQEENRTTSIEKNSTEQPDINISQNFIVQKKEIQKDSTKKIEDTEVKKVDREKLKSFIDNIEDSIAKNIDYNIVDSNKTEDEYLKIRVTLLKSGDYEQLTFVEGNEELFEKNKENITKTFPLSIDKDIIEDFPRYIRIELKKKF